MFNSVGVMGRFAHAPELKRTQSGTPVVSFTLAVDRDFKNDNGERGTDWIDCVAWRSVAEFIAKHFEKGQSALIRGRLQTRSWTDANGNKRRSTEVLVEDIYFVGSPPSRTSVGPQKGSYAPQIGASEFEPLPENERGIPF